MMTLAIICIVVSWTGLIINIMAYKIAYKHGYADGTKDERKWKAADECLMHTPVDEEVMPRTWKQTMPRGMGSASGTSDDTMTNAITLPVVMKHGITFLTYQTFVHSAERK